MCMCMLNKQESMHFKQNVAILKLFDKFIYLRIPLSFTKR